MKITRQEYLSIAVLALHHTCNGFVVLIQSPKTKLMQSSLTNMLYWSLYTETEDGGDATHCAVNLKETQDRKLGQEMFGLQSPRRWLEYWERQDGQEGAYTVLRCDLCVNRRDWTVWGRSFHLNRLASSFVALKGDQNTTTCEIARAAAVSESHIDELIKSAADSIQSPDQSPVDGVVALMLTILWVPDPSGTTRVRCHAVHSGEAMVPLDYDPDAAIVSIARLSASDKKDCDALPNRYDNLPKAKLSDWCRRRSPLEQKFKFPGIGEVLLIRELNGDAEVLEGLASNIFIVYKDGTIRTPSDELVLGGYARQLVLKHAEKCGRRVVVGPVFLSEMGQWEEVFATSSIRVIFPVGKIVVTEKASDGTTNVSTLWGAQEQQEIPLWRCIYTKILECFQS